MVERVRGEVVQHLGEDGDGGVEAVAMRYSARVRSSCSASWLWSRARSWLRFCCGVAWPGLCTVDGGEGQSSGSAMAVAV